VAVADPETAQRRRVGAENSIKDILAASGTAKCIFLWAILVWTNELLKGFGTCPGLQPGQLGA